MSPTKQCFIIHNSYGLVEWLNLHARVKLIERNSVVDFYSILSYIFLISFLLLVLLWNPRFPSLILSILCTHTQPLCQRFILCAGFCFSFSRPILLFIFYETTNELIMQRNSEMHENVLLLRRVFFFREPFWFMLILRFNHTIVDRFGFCQVVNVCVCVFYNVFFLHWTYLLLAHITFQHISTHQHGK